MNKETPRPSSVVMAELRELQEEAASLKIEIAELESTLKAKQARYNELHGGPWSRGDGLLRDKSIELEDAKRFEEDADKPVVVWKKSPYSDANRIVSRVTPKRIFIRRRGEKREDQYNRDGTPVSYGDAIIDVEATLGEMAGKE